MKRRLIACILAFTMLVGPGADLVPAAGRVSIYAEEAVIGTDPSETTGQTDTGIPNAEELSLTEGSGSDTNTEQAEEAAPAGEESAQAEQSKGGEADPELTDPKESPAEGTVWEGKEKLQWE